MRVETANLDFGTGKRADRKHLAELCERADLLLLQETWNIRVGELLPPGWKAKQSSRDLGRANNAIAWNPSAVKLTRFRLRLGTHPYGAVMRTRWIGIARAEDLTTGEVFKVITAHMPPARYRRLWPQMTHNLRRHVTPRTVIGADVNMPIDDFAAALGLTAHGRGIIGVFTGPAVEVTGCRVFWTGLDNGWADHPTVRVRVRRAADRKLGGK